MVGRIVKLGDGVTTDFAGNPVKVGDRIASTYFVTCRQCKPCQEEKFHLCENAIKFWSKDAEEAPHFHGSFATHYYIHPNQYFYKVPENVPDSTAASANCALSQVYFGIEKAGLRYGETILIQGAGGLGLNAAAVAKEFGARVVVVDGVASRLEKARLFGADYTINMSERDTLEKRIEDILEITGGKGADVAMELTGVAAAFSEGIHLLKAGGRYVSIGTMAPGKTIPFDPAWVTRKSLHIIGIVRYDPWYLQKALQFLAAKGSKYPFDQLLDCDFDLEDIQDALDKSARREITRASIVIK